MDAHFGVFDPIDGESGGDFDVGIVEVGEFCFPVLVFEFQEESADNRGVVQFGFGVVFDFIGSDLGARFSGGAILTAGATGTSRAASTTGATARGPEPASAACWALFFQGFAGGLPFSVIEPLVAVLIVFGNQFAFFATRPASSTGTELRSGEGEGLAGHGLPFGFLTVIQNSQHVLLRFLLGLRQAFEIRRKATQLGAAGCGEFFQLGLLFGGEFKLSGDFGPDQGCAPFTLQTQFSQAGDLRPLENFGQVLVCLLSDLVGPLSNAFELLLPFGFAEIEELGGVEISHRFAEFVMCFRDQFVEDFLLRVGDLQFLADFGQIQQHDARRRVAGAERSPHAGGPEAASAGSAGGFGEEHCGGDQQDHGAAERF